MRHIAALVPNQLGFSPGQRSRIELWAKYLEDEGWVVTFVPFEDDALHDVLYHEGQGVKKGVEMLRSYGRHLGKVMGGLDADVHYLYREAAMLGPALTERILARRSCPLVYDLDDPAWIRYRSPANGWMSLLKFPGKTRSIIRMSDRVLAINERIGDYARGLNPSVSVIPNPIDTERYQPSPEPRPRPFRVGWIGSFSTMGNLQTIVRPLAQLQERTGARVRVIGSGTVDLPGVEVEVREWSQEAEVALLNECHVGLVPLTDHPWNEWKFFFKTIQYMALAIPVVARRMGSNPEVIDDGVNGFLVDNEQEWLDRLQLLADDEDRRQEMGAAARKSVEERYSLVAQMPQVVDLFGTLLAPR